MGPRHSDTASGEGGLGFSCGLEKLLKQHLARVDRVLRRTHNTSSVAIDDARIERLARSPTEDHAPLLIDPNREPTGPIALERPQASPGRPPKVTKIFSLT
jgi:hypothetical protein